MKANLAAAYAFKGKLDKAEMFFEELIAEKPHNKYMHASLSSILERKGNVKKALDTLNRMNIFPQGDWKFDFLVGRLYHKNEDYEQAVVYLKKAINANESLSPKKHLVYLYIDCCIYEPAIPYAEEISTIKPSGIRFHNLSLLFFNCNNYEKSILYSRRALDAGYNEIQAYTLLCNSLLMGKKILQAKEEFENALKIYQEDLSLKINYAVVLSRLERVEESISILNDIIESNPKCAPAYLAVATVYFREGFYDKAIENAKKSIHLEPENEDAHYMIGNSLLKLGNVDESVEELKKVTEINPNSKYARLIDIEEFYQDSDFIIASSQYVIDKYQKGIITLSKLGGLIHKETSYLLQYLNNSKINESLGLSGEELVLLDYLDVEKKCVLVDETILYLLAKIGGHDLLKLAFTHVYITDEVEGQIVNGLYLSDHPNKKIKKSLHVLGNGWIEGLTPNDMTILAIKKIIPEDKVSKNDIFYMSLALDKNCICLTEDLLLRTFLKQIGRPTGSFVGFLKYMVVRNLINDEDAEKLIKDAKSVCAIDFDN